MKNKRMYLIGREIEKQEHFWTSCGWSTDRSGASEYPKGEAKYIVSQMHEDDKFAYIV